LEIDLKNYEVIEKRRLEVSYGTEQTLGNVKNDLHTARKEISFLERHKKDLELALGTKNP
jgi:hypothetical protein